MEPSSWLPALVCAAGLILSPCVQAYAQDKDRSHDSARSDATAGTASQDPSKDVVKLKLLIAGLSRNGCDVEVKPGNRSCKFKPQVQHVGSPGDLSFQFKDVEVRGADRNCTFAITVREEGREAKTIYRGFRLAARNAATPAPGVQTFTCYMNSPSKLADLDRPDRIRK